MPKKISQEFTFYVGQSSVSFFKNFKDHDACRLSCRGCKNKNLMALKRMKKFLEDKAERKTGSDSTFQITDSATDSTMDVKVCDARIMAEDVLVFLEHLSAVWDGVYCERSRRRLRSHSNMYNRPN